VNSDIAHPIGTLPFHDAAPAAPERPAPAVGRARSPFWLCPHCHSVARRNDKYFRMAELAGALPLRSARCPDCGARFSLRGVYLDETYDAPLADVYDGKYGDDVPRNVRRAYDAGRIRLDEDELDLLQMAERRLGMREMKESTVNLIRGILVAGPAALFGVLAFLGNDVQGIGCMMWLMGFAAGGAIGMVLWTIVYGILRAAGYSVKWMARRPPTTG